MKVKNVAVVNGNVVINYTDNEGKDCAHWVNGTTDVASATQSFIALMNAGLLWPAFYYNSDSSLCTTIAICITLINNSDSLIQVKD